MPPRPAILLGLAGLLPALLACVIALAGPVEWSARAATVCATYDATVLSFLGGAWWGMGARGGAGLPPIGPVLVAGVLPALAAWAALLIDRGAGLMLIGLLFLGTLSGDAWLQRAGLAPDWWMRLRVPLSVAMGAVALVLGAATLRR
jgi:hypothetical protein